MKTEHKALTYALVAVLMWSTVASAFKISLKYMSPSDLLLFSNGVSLFVFGILICIQKKIVLLKNIKKSEIIRSLSFGILNPFLYYLILFEAYNRLPAQVAQPLNFTWAITLSLLSIPLLKQQIRLREFVAMLVSYSGVVLLVTGGKPFDFYIIEPWGIALALGSTIIWALFWIFNTKNRQDPLVCLFLNFVGSFPFVCVYALIVGCSIPSWQGILGATYVGVFEMGITFVLWLNGLRMASNTAKVSNLIFLAPLISFALISFIVGEVIQFYSWVALLLILSGTLWQQYMRH